MNYTRKKHKNHFTHHWKEATSRLQHCHCAVVWDNWIEHLRLQENMKHKIAIHFLKNDQSANTLMLHVFQQRHVCIAFQLPHIFEAFYPLSDSNSTLMSYPMLTWGKNRLTRSLLWAFLITPTPSPCWPFIQIDSLSNPGYFKGNSEPLFQQLWLQKYICFDLWKFKIFWAQGIKLSAYLVAFFALFMSSTANNSGSI